MEIEALESIFMDDIKRLPENSGDGIAHASSSCYQVEISAYGENDSEPEEGKERDDAVLGLVFAHTERYPDEPPLLKCRSVRGLREGELGEISALVLEQSETSVGQAMIFDLTQTCKDWMRRRAGASDFVDEETEEELRARLEHEAEERLRQMRINGTPVTIENFKSWQLAFIKERGESFNPGRVRDADELTGRQYFESARKSGKDVEADGGDGSEGDFEPDTDSSEDDFADSDSDVSSVDADA